MSSMRNLLVSLVALVLIVGCRSRPGAGPDAAGYSLLQDVNELLHAAAGANGRPPAKLVDLDRYKSTFPRGYEAVKSGDVVVVWGTPIKGEGEVGKDEVVIAYEKNTPTEGGLVLLSAGTAKRVSASEFNSLPRAGK